MTDKEPRKRRRRKDASRKDEPIHTDSHTQNTFNLRDSDQDQEEEPVAPAPSHEPSRVAQIIFTMLSLLLLVAISTVFIALRGSQVDRGPSEDSIQFMDALNILSEPTGVPDVQLKDDVDMIVDDYGAESNIFAETYEEQLEMEPNESTLDHSTISSLEEHEAIDIEEDESVQTEDDESVQTEEAESVQTEEAESVQTEEAELEDNLVITDFSSDPAYFTTTDEIELAASLPEAHEVAEDINMADAEESAPQMENLNEQDFIESSDVQQEDLVHPIDAVADATDDMKPDEVEVPPISTTTQVHDPPEEIPMTSTPSHSVSPDEIEEDDQKEELPQKDVQTPQPSDQTEEESLVDNLQYEPVHVTNQVDLNIKKELDDTEKVIEKNPEKALKNYEGLLKQHPASHTVLYGKARALDRIAELRRSNKYLEDAIAAYRLVMSQVNVSDELYLLAGERCVKRMQFRGFVGKSLKLLLEMAERFPRNVGLKNQIAVGYLLIGQNGLARQVLTEIVRDHPKNGFAKAHLGFILKTDESNYEEAIPLLAEGISSREEGVIDGRFYFHLGDALARVGKSKEAMKVYEEGVAENIFLSVYQRSLYNVEGLTAKPWWKTDDNIYASYLKKIEKNWLDIKAEALALAGSSQFTPESEGLQDRGEWEQFELFVRGKKISENCAAVPLTCSLIEQIPDAATCKRGQVKFSIMKPGTHVWAHTGPTNCRLRAHLGLVIPEGVRIRVANETRTWENGKVLLFDDSFEHEVWHEGSSLRLVLIIDFWHPELTMQQRASLSPI